jgi:hypothetical protein
MDLHTSPAVLHLSHQKYYAADRAALSIRVLDYDIQITGMSLGRLFDLQGFTASAQCFERAVTGRSELQ